MKKIISLIFFLTSLFSQYEIEGRWHLVGYEDNVMYQFDDNYRYSIYSEDGTFGSIEDGGGTPNPYTVVEDIITIDLFFGNIVNYQMNYICDGQVVEFEDTLYETIHSILFRESYNYIDNECEDQIGDQIYPGIMIDISGGAFIMGNNNQPPMSNDQDPEHSVTIDDFKIGETEVSNAYYATFLNDMASVGNLVIEEGIPGDWASTPEEIANGHAWSIMADSTISDLWSGQVLIKLSDIAGGGQHPLNRCWIELDTTSYTFTIIEGYENWPASWVSWYGAMIYADYYGVTLPTEAEWEYAARADQQLEYPTNDGSLSYSQANYGTGFGGPSGETYLTPIGEIYPPNPFGLYNMAGNVSEWCLDWYDENFYQTCIDNDIYLNPLNDDISGDLEKKVLRGGNHTYPSHVALSSSRSDTPPFVTTDHMGFRVVAHNDQGDINDDGSIDILDIVVTINFVLSNEYNSSADLNSDGLVNILDIVQLVNIILN